MALKLFNTIESKDRNQAQNQRDVIRTQEIRKLVSDSQLELTKVDAKFKEVLARQKEQWAIEEQKHAVRVGEMNAEVTALERRKEQALIPIDLHRREADNMFEKARIHLLEVNRRENELEDLKDIFKQKIEDLSDRENAVQESESKIAVEKQAIKDEKLTTAANTKSLSEAIAKFNDFVAQQNLLISEEKKKIFMENRSIEAKKELNNEKESRLLIKEKQLQDGRETLARAFKRINMSIDETIEKVPEEINTEEGIEYTGPMAKYKVVGEIFPLNEDGSKQDVALEIGSIHELPKGAVTQEDIDNGLWEEVTESAITQE